MSSYSRPPVQESLNVVGAGVLGIFTVRVALLP